MRRRPTAAAAAAAAAAKVSFSFYTLQSVESFENVFLVLRVKSCEQFDAIRLHHFNSATAVGSEEGRRRRRRDAIWQLTRFRRSPTK